VAAGSAAGFRVRESFLGFGNDTVGRTTAVTGALVLSGRQVTEASFRIDLTAITVNGKPQDQVAHSLDTKIYPAATIGPSHPCHAHAAALVTNRRPSPGLRENPSGSPAATSRTSSASSQDR